MAWTAPPVYTVGQLLTAALMNGISGDLSDLDLRTQVVKASVGPNDATSSTSFTDLANVGPQVSLVTGTIAMVAMYCQAQNTTASCGWAVGVAVSGATTMAAPAASVLLLTANSQSTIVGYGAAFPITGLTAGTNVFTLKYEVVGGGTATFYGSGLGGGTRFLAVWPGNKLS